MKDWNQCIPDLYLLLDRHYTPGRSGHALRFIGIHYMAGDLSGQQCYNVWQTREASAQYSVDRNGTVAQHVNDWDTAWALANWDANCESINIEHANQGDSMTAATLEEGAHLVAALCRLYGLGRPQWGVNMRGHMDFIATSCPGPLYGKYKASYERRAQEWYDAMVNGGAAPAPKPQEPVAPPSDETLGIAPVTVTYGLRKLNGAWHGDVVNFNNVDHNGYAGEPNAEHDLLFARVDRGILRYQAYTREDGWLEWVEKGDKSDTVHGCAGVLGHAICGVRFYYVTPDGEAFQQAWYRSQTTRRMGYLETCCDDGNSWPGYDGWAGIYDEPLDRLQLKIAPSDPF